MLLSGGTTESGIVCSICTHNRHLSFSPNLTQVRDVGYPVKQPTEGKAVGGVPGHSRGSRVLYKAGLYPGEILKSDTFCNLNTHMLWVDYLNSTLCGHGHFPIRIHIIPPKFHPYPWQNEAQGNWKRKEYVFLSPRWLWLLGGLGYHQQNSYNTRHTLHPPHQRPARLGEWMEDSKAGEG